MHLGYSYIVLTIRTYFIAETIALTYFEDYVSYMNSTTTINTLPKSEVPTIELCHKEKSNITSLTAALSVLSVITTILIVAVVFMAIITDTRGCYLMLFLTK